MKLTDRDFIRLSEFICERYGINLEAKRTLIEARLSFYVEQCGFANFDAYINYITRASNREECQRMINRISTNYSYFFRETDYIEHLRTHALPEFRMAGRGALSIWSAACAGGQEPYSIGMTLAFAGEAGGYPPEFRILGSDINTDVLTQAQLAVYDNMELNHIPASYRRYVKPYDEKSFQICDKIRACTHWKQENLLDVRTGASQYDLIFCRNVMIYFKTATRRRITKVLFDSLKYGGYLYTGATEAVDLERKYFKYIAPSIYKKEVLQ